MIENNSSMSLPFDLMDGADGSLQQLQQDVNQQRQISVDLSRPLEERLEAYEIYDELGDAPVSIATPVSNGTTFAGIFKGFASLYRRGKISRMPRMVAGSSFRKNPIIHAALKNKATCEDLVPDKIKETRVNEPLINWHAIDGNIALKAIRETNGWAADASDKAMRSYSKLIREREGLDVLPASTAGLIAMINQHKKEPLPNDRYVVVLTGRKS